MKSITHFGGAVLAALLVCAISATAASAGTPRLMLRVDGAPLTGTGLADISIGENAGKEAPFTCFVAESGPIGNPAPTVRIKPSTPAFTECKVKFAPTTEYSVTGSIRQLAMSWTGDVTAWARVQITEPGPCIYTYTHLRASTEIPGISVAVGTVQGFASKGSNLFCAPVQTMPLVLFALGPSEEFPTTELLK